MATEKVKRKASEIQKEVLLSVYSYNNKPVSVLGIKHEKTMIGHDILKSTIPAEGWFRIAAHIRENAGIKEDVKSMLINNILGSSSEVKFPEIEAIKLRDYVELKHTIVKKLIEVG